VREGEEEAEEEEASSWGETFWLFNPPGASSGSPASAVAGRAPEPSKAASLPAAAETGERGRVEAGGLPRTAGWMH